MENKILTIIQKIKSFFGKVEDLFSQVFGTTIKKIIVLSCFLFFLLCLMIVAFLPKNQKETLEIPEQIEYSDSLLYPNQQVHNNQFEYSRLPHNQWTEADMIENFTMPTEEMLQDLENSNTQKIKNLLEAVQ